MLLLIRGPNIRKRKEGNDKMYFTIDCFFEYISYFQPHLPLLMSYLLTRLKVNPRPREDRFKIKLGQEKIQCSK